MATSSEQEKIIDRVDKELSEEKQALNAMQTRYDSLLNKYEDGGKTEQARYDKLLARYESVNEAKVAVSLELQDANAKLEAMSIKLKAVETAKPKSK